MAKESRIWNYKGKQFKYRYEDAVVEWGFINDNGEWEEIDGAGLRRENWTNLEARKEYISEWIMDIDEEALYLMDMEEFF